MASQLRVDSVLPSTGSSLGIGTASGTVTLYGNLNSSSTPTFSSGLNVTSGSVGIGTDNPSHKLDVVGDSQLYGVVTVGDNTDISPSSSGTGQLKIDGNGYTPYIAADGTAMYIGHNSSARDLILQTNETNRLTIDGSNGYVGIGTDNPQTGLHIDSSTNAQSRITISKAGFLRNNFIGLDGDADELVIAADEGDEGPDSHIRFKVDGTEKLRITGIGSVGIRTDVPKTNVDINLYSTSDYYRATVKINQYGHILQQNNQQVVLSGVSSYWALAPRDDGEFDIAFGEADGDFNVTGFNVLELQPNGNVSIPNGNLAFASGNGIDFSATGDSSGTMTSELLDDYEEGTFTMTMSCGGNTASQECRYTKIGRIVYIDGHGAEVTGNFFNTGANGTAAAATITTNLPFTPVRTGAAPITVSRTLVGSNGFKYERMYVGWRKDSATIYLGSENNNYMPVDNVVTDSTNQTNKTILFSGHFVTEV